MGRPDPDDRDPAPRRADEIGSVPGSSPLTVDPDAEREHVPVARLVESLPAGTSGSRREAAAATLAAQARVQPSALDGHVPALIDALGRETAAESEARGSEGSLALRAHLVRCLGFVLIDHPGAVSGDDGLARFAGAVTTDLPDGTLRVAARALFVAAGDRSPALAPAVDPLGDLVRHPDEAVRAWSAGALGRLAGDHSAAVAATADGLRACLDGEGAVTHNAVEALAALARERPGAVAPAAGALRGLLAHEEAAVRHNAAGVLGRIAGSHPDAVLPALDRLRDLRDDDEAAVRRVAAAALAQLARERPGAVSER